MVDFEDPIETESEDSIKEKIAQARQEYTELGGWPALKSGDWLSQLILRSFNNYWKNANVEYFEDKYGTDDPGIIEKKLISVAARNSALLGAVTGATISLDEILAILGAIPTAGMSLPANIAIALTAIAAETFLLVRFQLQLICNLAKLHKVPLDPNDPEDILTIIGFALTGGISDLSSKGLAKWAAKFFGRKKTKDIFSGNRLKLAQDLMKPLGIKVLQKNIVKYAVPIVSIGLGSSLNYLATKSVAKYAKQKFKEKADGTHDENVSV